MANYFFQTIFRECLQVRSKNLHDFRPHGDSASKLEYQPWTSAPGPKGLRTLLIRQFNLTLEKAVPIAGIYFPSLLMNIMQLVFLKIFIHTTILNPLALKLPQNCCIWEVFFTYYFFFLHFFGL